MIVTFRVRVSVDTTDVRLHQVHIEVPVGNGESLKVINCTNEKCKKAERRKKRVTNHVVLHDGPRLGAHVVGTLPVFCVVPSRIGFL